MLNQGLGSWPYRLARRNPDGVAILAGQQRITFADLAVRTQTLAAQLETLGVRPGDRVAFLGGNCPDFFDMLFAAGLIGAVFVPLNTRLAALELHQHLADSGTSVLVHDAERSALAHQTISVAEPLDREVLVIAAGDLVDLPAVSPQRPDVAVSPNDPCLIMFTSGTTGAAKGVVLTHSNLTWNALNVVVDIDLHVDEVALIVSPLFHAAALGMNSLPVLLKGGTLVLAPTAAPTDMLELIERHRVTHLQGVPTIYQALLDAPQFASTDTSTLRRANSGGSAAPAELIHAYLDRGIAFCQGYGMTEAAPGVCFLGAAASGRKAGSVGVPMFFTDVRVLDLDDVDVQPTADGTTPAGEVVVSGPNVTPGYWGQPEATAAAFTEDGWYRSGDLATVDAEGALTIVDRKKDMFISGGENVYPAEVEAALGQHPDVAECAVIAIPDTKWGEVGRAVVVGVGGATTSVAELQTFLRDRLAAYKIPKTMIFLDHLPRTAYGKVRKADLRANYSTKETP